MPELNKEDHAAEKNDAQLSGPGTVESLSRRMAGPSLASGCRVRVRGMCLLLRVLQ